MIGSGALVNPLDSPRRGLLSQVEATLGFFVPFCWERAGDGHISFGNALFLRLFTSGESRISRFACTHWSVPFGESAHPGMVWLITACGSPLAEVVVEVQLRMCVYPYTRMRATNRWQDNWESNSRRPRHLGLNVQTDGGRKMPHFCGETPGNRSCHCVTVLLFHTNQDAEEFGSADSQMKHSVKGIASPACHRCRQRHLPTDKGNTTRGAPERAKPARPCNRGQRRARPQPHRPLCRDGRTVRRTTSTWIRVHLHVKNK